VLLQCDPLGDGASAPFLRQTPHDSASCSPPAISLNFFFSPPCCFLILSRELTGFQVGFPFLLHSGGRGACRRLLFLKRLRRRQDPYLLFFSRTTRYFRPARQDCLFRPDPSVTTRGKRFRATQRFRFRVSIPPRRDAPPSRSAAPHGFFYCSTFHPRNRQFSG